MSFLQRQMEDDDSLATYDPLKDKRRKDQVNYLDPLGLDKKEQRERPGGSHGEYRVGDRSRERDKDWHRERERRRDRSRSRERERDRRRERSRSRERR